MLEPSLGAKAMRTKLYTCIICQFKYTGKNNAKLVSDIFSCYGPNEATTCTRNGLGHDFIIEQILIQNK